MQIDLANEVVRVGGLEALSGGSVPLFKEGVKSKLLPEHRVVEVDLSQVRLVDSEGLGALIAIRRLIAAQGGKVRLLYPRPSVQQTFDLVQFERIFEIVH
ncbi:MAG: STAS domain-containing protein [Verrucomicrobiae bacterium]|nr:STAS domain-containing protein [Verrucomicrobiae bacterium]